jgi:23S rRNA (pseudouridine1915-N3)-methyltransferase
MAMKVNIIAVGKVKEKSINQLIEEYTKRLGPYLKLNIKELKDEGLAKESDKIRNIIQQDSENTFILDALGKQFSSEEFSEFMKNKQEVTFIIGGPDGISDDVKKKAKTVSFSKMTFTHEMCRLFLIEQIYRGVMIEKGRPYHK